MSAAPVADRAEVVEAMTPATPARLAAVLAVVVALAGAFLGPTGRLDGLLGPAAVRVADGEIEVLAEQGWDTVPVGSGVSDGATLRAPAGLATLDVPGGAVELAEGTRLVVGDVLDVRSGTVLVRSPRITVGDGVVAATGPGTWRWDAGGRVGAYRGSVVVTDATDREALVRPLQEVALRDQVLAGPARPYVYTGADPFDRRELGTAFDVDQYVQALRQGLAADYGTAPQPRAFYTDFDGFDGQLVIALGDVGFERVGDRVGPPADVLVASVVTDAMVVDAGLAPDDAAVEVRDSRVAGATWGLIAQSNDLGAGQVRAAAERALTRRELAEADGSAQPVQATAATPVPDPAGPGTETTPGAGAEGPTTAPSSPGQGGDTGDGDDGGEDGLVRSLLEDAGADELVDEGPAGGLVDDIVDRVDDAVGDPGAGAERAGTRPGRGVGPSEVPDVGDEVVGGLLGN